MSSKLNNPSGKLADFKQIRGIGPGVEARLHSAGITSFYQLAALSPADVAAALGGMSGLSAERIIKQNWLEQAAALVNGHSPAEILDPNKAAETLLLMPEKALPTATASFSLELVLGAGNHLDRTRIVHLDSAQQAEWTGWQASELESFLWSSAEVVQPKIQPQRAPLQPLGGQLRLCGLKVIPPENSSTNRLFPAGQPLEVGLTLDLSEVTLVEANCALYLVMVYARSFDKKVSKLVASSNGFASPAKSYDLRLPFQGLEAGTYRLEANVTVTLPALQTAPHYDLLANTAGDLLQFF